MKRLKLKNSLNKFNRRRDYTNKTSKRKKNFSRKWKSKLKKTQGLKQQLSSTKRKTKK